MSSRISYVGYPVLGKCFWRVVPYIKKSKYRFGLQTLNTFSDIVEDRKPDSERAKKRQEVSYDFVPCDEEVQKGFKKLAAEFIARVSALTSSG
jgi:hypothetical protein